MDFFLKYYSPVSLVDILEYLKTGRSLPENAFLLTFDDGFRELHDVVAPILLSKGINATFFICSAFIDNNCLFYQHKASILIEYFQQKEVLRNLKERVKRILMKARIEFNDIKSGLLSINYQQKDLLDEIALIMDVDFNDYLMRNAPYLTSDQIKSLIRDGFTIGAHSIDHPLYSMLSLKDQLHQTIESTKQIKENFGLDYGVFAFPHSDNNVYNEFFVELHSSGLVDVSFGTGGLIEDSVLNNLQRFSMEKPLIPAKKLVTYQFARKLYRLLSGKVQIIR